MPQPTLQGAAARNLICHWLCSFCILSLFAAEAGEHVQLAPYPQKIRTSYSTNDPSVPPMLRSNSVPLPLGNITATARSSDGATWLGTTQGLVRLDFTATERDRRQY